MLIVVGGSSGGREQWWEGAGHHLALGSGGAAMFVRQLAGCVQPVVQELVQPEKHVVWVVA